MSCKQVLGRSKTFWLTKTSTRWAICLRTWGGLDLASSRAGGPMLYLTTAQAGCWNIPNLSQPNQVCKQIVHPLLIWNKEGLFDGKCVACLFFLPGLVNGWANEIDFRLIENGACRRKQETLDEVLRVTLSSEQSEGVRFLRIRRRGSYFHQSKRATV